MGAKKGIQPYNVFVHKTDRGCHGLYSRTGVKLSSLRSADQAARREDNPGGDPPQDRARWNTKYYRTPRMTLKMKSPNQVEFEKLERLSKIPEMSDASSCLNVSDHLRTNIHRKQINVFLLHSNFLDGRMVLFTGG